jgi:hypothetical protein
MCLRFLLLEQAEQGRAMLHPAGWAALQVRFDLGQEGVAALCQELGIVLHDSKALIASEVRSPIP